MKKLLFLFLIISQYSIAQISGSCTTCPPSGVGNSGKVLTSNGAKKSVYATVSAQTLRGVNGVTISGDSVVLGGTLSQPTYIITGDKNITFGTDSSFNNIFAINPEYGLVYEATLITDSFSFGTFLNSTGFKAQVLNNLTGDRQYINIDTFEADLRLENADDRYQCGVYNNDATELDYTSELSIHSISGATDKYSLRLHHGWLDYMIDGDTSSLNPDAYGVFAHDSTILMIGRDGSMDRYVSAFVQDTSFSFKFDSAEAVIQTFYHDDTIHVNSNKPVVFNNLSVNKFTTADSATIYATTPSAGTTYFCSNCSGSGVTGRIVSYIGSLWRRLSFD